MSESPKSTVRGFLIAIIVMSIALGANLLTGFEYWLRGDSTFWIQIGVGVAFIFAIVTLSIRLLRGIS